MEIRPLEKCQGRTSDEKIWFIDKSDNMSVCAQICVYFSVVVKEAWQYIHFILCPSEKGHFTSYKNWLNLLFESEKWVKYFVKWKVFFEISHKPWGSRLCIENASSEQSNGPITFSGIVCHHFLSGASIRVFWFSNRCVSLPKLN